MRCPVCRVENAAGPACRRCKADLSVLWELESQRSALLESARAALAEGRPDEALELAREAAWHRADADAARLEALAHLLRGDYPAAWEAYRFATQAAAADS
jgi:hypothetical protein